MGERGRPASSSGISLPAGHYWPIACQEPLPIATAPVAATGSLSAVPPCGVPGSFYRRPRASSAPCPGAPRTTDSRAPRSAGFVRIACTVEGGRRTAHAQRSATSLRLILLQFDGRAAAPMLAKRPRGSGSSAAPSPLAVLAVRPSPSSPRRAPHAKRLRSSALFWTDLPTRPGPPEARRTAGLARPDGAGYGQAVLISRHGGGGGRLRAASPSEEPGPEISPGEPSGLPRSSAPSLFPRVRMRGGR
eukprot:tig00020592_g11665.t1